MPIDNRTPNLVFGRGAAAGVVIALLLFARSYFFDSLFGEVEFVVWPSSILLAVTNGWSWNSIFILSLSVVLNALWYGILALLLRIVVKRLRP